MTESEIVKMIEDWPVARWDIVEFAQEIQKKVLGLALAAVRAERLEDPTNASDDVAYESAVGDCERAIETLMEPANG